MKRIAALVLLILASCGGEDKRKPDDITGQLDIHVDTAPRTGVEMRTQGNRYREGNPAYETVEYGKIKQIFVMLSGEGLTSGPAKLAPELQVSDSGFNLDRFLLAGGKYGELKITNYRDKPVTVYCLGDSGDGFDVEVPNSGQVRVRMTKPGEYTILCEEDETFQALMVVSPNSYALETVTGGNVFFDYVPPGKYTLYVNAPRLPLWSERVTVVAGNKATVRAKISVDNLTDR